MRTANLTEYSPRLWDLVEKGKIKENSVLYDWLNSDQGQIVGEDKVFWVEYFSTYADRLTKTAWKQLKRVMKNEFGAEYLYDRFPVGRTA